MARYLLILCTVSLILTACGRKPDVQSGNVLLIINSNVNEVSKAKELLVPYLSHFGVPYRIIDLAKEKLSDSICDEALIILGHKGISGNSNENLELLDKFINKCSSNGTGLVSFDPQFSAHLALIESIDTVTFQTIDLKVSDVKHYITSMHKSGDTIKLFGKLALVKYKLNKGKALITNGDILLLSTSEKGHSKLVSWTSMDWISSYVLGPLGGMDDYLWRSLVWAARKPFVMHSLPPIVTMRVDDVAGRGDLWGQSPFYWVKTCNNYGLKPWLGLFIYNLSPRAIDELRGYILDSMATASPHALGRPPRTSIKNIDHSFYDKSNDIYAGLYYNPKALPLRVKDYDEFLYFDHHHGRPWSDLEAERGLKAVDEWYEANKPFPMSKYFLAHYYEIGGNVIKHVAVDWKMEFIGQNKAIDMPWADSVPWIKGGPFRLYENPGTSTNSNENRGKNPVYYADFTNINGYTFFNSLTEIRDDAGYEWAPDNNNEKSSGRAIRQLERALNSFATAVLFTHETDYIFRISPENWENQIKTITSAIASYKPVYLTSDDGIRLVRAFHTSQLTNCNIHNKENFISAEITGTTDVPTSVYVFTGEDENITYKLVTIPVFKGNSTIQIK